MAIKLATKKDKKSFFKTLQERARKRRNPHNVMFELTYKCNFRCGHCYLPGGYQEKKELSTKEVLLILDQLKEMGVHQIGFTGGEALVREDIFEILAYAAKSGFRSTLLSNGFLIDAKTADKLKAVHIGKVDLTFNSSMPKVFDEIAQIKGAFKRVKKAIDVLKKRGINFKLKASCMSVNKEEIETISKFARDLGVIFTIDGEILPFRSGDSTWVDKYSINGKEYEELRRKVYPEMFAGDRVRSRSRKKRYKMFNCDVGLSSFCINPYGEMNFCLEIDYPRYNIISQGAASCWEKIKQEVDELNSKPDFVCKDCGLFHFCGWCPGRSYIEGKGFNCCSSFFKERAQQQKKTRKEMDKWEKQKC